MLFHQFCPVVLLCNSWPENMYNMYVLQIPFRIKEIFLLKNKWTWQQWSVYLETQTLWMSRDQSTCYAHVVRGQRWQKPVCRKVKVNVNNSRFQNSRIFFFYFCLKRKYLSMFFFQINIKFKNNSLKIKAIFNQTSTE